MERTLDLSQINLVPKQVSIMYQLWTYLEHVIIPKSLLPFFFSKQSGDTEMEIDMEMESDNKCESTGM